MELKKEDKELGGYRSDLPAQASVDDQALFAYMQFLRATVRLAEPLIVRELPVAVSGDDADRVAWAVKAAPICSVVSKTVLAERSPDPRTELLRREYGHALRTYVLLAATWIEAEGVHTNDAQASLTSGAARWKHASDATESVDRGPSRT
jgi:hypothetical protein